jgi:hypothetical protein
MTENILKRPVCTVLDSWWWTVNLSETCRVLYQNKFEKLVHLVGFYYMIPDSVPFAYQSRALAHNLHAIVFFNVPSWALILPFHEPDIKHVFLPVIGLSATVRLSLLVASCSLSLLGRGWLISVLTGDKRDGLRTWSGASVSNNPDDLFDRSRRDTNDVANKFLLAPSFTCLSSSSPGIIWCPRIHTKATHWVHSVFIVQEMRNRYSNWSCYLQRISRGGLEFRE